MSDRTLHCSCKAPPGKTGPGRQRRRNNHQSECELVVYVEKLEHALQQILTDAEELASKAAAAIALLGDLGS